VDADSAAERGAALLTAAALSLKPHPPPQPLSFRGLEDGGEEPGDALEGEGHEGVWGRKGKEEEQEKE
jgi:hypothetical protein